MAEEFVAVVECSISQCTACSSYVLQVAETTLDDVDDVGGAAG